MPCNDEMLTFWSSKLLMVLPRQIPLRACSVAEFYQETMTALGTLEMPVTIWTTPVEVPDRTPFEKDQKFGAFLRKPAECLRNFVPASPRIGMSVSNISISTRLQPQFERADMTRIYFIEEWGILVCLSFYTILHTKKISGRYWFLHYHTIPFIH